MNKPVRIAQLEEKKLVGKCIEMSLIDNKNFELFSGFMSKRHDISDTLSSDVYEVMVYDDLYFKTFSPTNTFLKYATLEVSTFDSIPEDMKTYILKAGLYAIFDYKGLAKDFGVFMASVFTEWLPKSEYKLDNRPHFNVLGEHYKNNHPDSEEEVWIPILLKEN